MPPLADQSLVADVILRLDIGPQSAMEFVAHPADAVVISGLGSGQKGRVRGHRSTSCLARSWVRCRLFHDPDAESVQGLPDIRPPGLRDPEAERQVARPTAHVKLDSTVAEGKEQAQFFPG